MTVTNTAIPTLTGTAKQGQTLHTSNGSWTFDLDYLTYAYQWLRCDAAGANCSPIGGATNSNYLVQSADIGSTLRSEVTATEHAGATPPAGSYFLSDWSSGQIAYPPWATIFSYTNPGYLDCGYGGGSPRTGSADGRVSVVANPYGAGNVLRCESRDTDPGWPVVTALSKSEVSSVKATTWPNGNFTFGKEIWISLEIYLPDEFSLASGGTAPFTVIGGLHPSSGSGVSCLELSTGSGNATAIQLGVGTSYQRINLIPLVPGNRNRLLSVIIGAKIDPNPGVGWVEAWFDGVNTIPRFNLAMAVASESGPYWKQGMYTAADCSFTGGSVAGRTVVYFGTTALYSAQPF